MADEKRTIKVEVVIDESQQFLITSTLHLSEDERPDYWRVTATETTRLGEDLCFSSPYTTDDNAVPLYGIKVAIDRVLSYYAFFGR